ncbi:mammalian cell entry protein [Mycolicibacterium austroafricanum]|uniref:mammalian cell entry protein n=1 Tax=Mycolicibacterium austroafricanum TaxID=39687 RepID=UPI001CA380E5|nr:mammalian cell entry protein [Mycolicibacterium austroafricanum]QZT62241.1 mammalian cell entry protein [Mycolicibacterium austroafricanum]
MQESVTPPQRVRRRASRAAGPVGDSATPAPASVSVEVTTPVRPVRPIGPPPRRRPHRRLVAILSIAVTFVAVAALVVAVAVMVNQQRTIEAQQERERRFVDTAAQSVVNMFSYTQNTIDESVDRFVNGTSGPLRAMMTQEGNVENLKLLFRDTNATSEAVVNGAALEKIDEIGRNAAVLVSVRVTVTDLDGNNAPSEPYRMRVIIHEDDNGHMTAYDLKYPDGGN